jgi:hypothetical protein
MPRRQLLYRVLTASRLAGLSRDCRPFWSFAPLARAVDSAPHAAWLMDSPRVAGVVTNPCTGGSASRGNLPELFGLGSFPRPFRLPEGPKKPTAKAVGMSEASAARRQRLAPGRRRSTRAWGSSSLNLDKRNDGRLPSRIPGRRKIVWVVIGLLAVGTVGHTGTGEARPPERLGRSDLYAGSNPGASWIVEPRTPPRSGWECQSG